MNFNKFVNSDYLKNNPLCGIDTYKDELNLATGACTRRIKKLVLTGEENFVNQTVSGITLVSLTRPVNMPQYASGIISSHFVKTSPASNVGEFYVGGSYINFNYDGINDVTMFKTYLQQQYSNGVPVCVWYVLATPTTETITVPSGLSGTEEGYLIQDGTPTPTNPIYPTANTVEKWFDINHYIMGTSTDTITTLPAVLYPNAVTATVGLKGNMEQNGTPTPSSPIQPQECGERTENLITSTNFTTNALYINVATLKSAVDNDSLFVLSLETNITFTSNSLYLHTDSDNRIVTTLNGIGRVSTAFKLTETDVNNIKSSNNPYFYIYKSGTDFSSTSVELRSGYKIPISSANTTTPIYLGEVETTRKIKKYELTGNENISETTIGSKTIFQISQATVSDKKYGVATETMICSHYKVIDGRTNLETNDNAITTYNASNNNALLIRDDNCVTLTDFTTYLAQQYTNGTPVTVWYVLATPTTGIVNEPIRKIGEYADTVSGISIPTITGADSFDVQTTLKPSEVTATYKGWHPVADVHERENGQWD